MLIEHLEQHKVTRLYLRATHVPVLQHTQQSTCIMPCAAGRRGIYFRASEGRVEYCTDDSAGAHARAPAEAVELCEVHLGRPLHVLLGAVGELHSTGYRATLEAPRGSPFTLVTRACVWLPRSVKSTSALVLTDPNGYTTFIRSLRRSIVWSST